MDADTPRRGRPERRNPIVAVISFARFEALERREKMFRPIPISRGPLISLGDDVLLTIDNYSWLGARWVAVIDSVRNGTSRDVISYVSAPSTQLISSSRNVQEVHLACPFVTTKRILCLGVSSKAEIKSPLQLFYDVLKTWEGISSWVWDTKTRKFQGENERFPTISRFGNRRRNILILIFLITFCLSWIFCVEVEVDCINK